MLLVLDVEASELAASDSPARLWDPQAAASETTAGRKKGLANRMIGRSGDLL
jgi:hypothetical protein